MYSWIVCVCDVVMRLMGGGVDVLMKKGRKGGSRCAHQDRIRRRQSRGGHAMAMM